MSPEEEKRLAWYTYNAGVDINEAIPKAEEMFPGKERFTQEEAAKVLSELRGTIEETGKAERDREEITPENISRYFMAYYNSEANAVMYDCIQPGMEGQSDGLFELDAAFDIIRVLPESEDVSKAKKAAKEVNPDRLKTKGNKRKSTGTRRPNREQFITGRLLHYLEEHKTELSAEILFGDTGIRGETLVSEEKLKELLDPKWIEEMRRQGYNISIISPMGLYSKLSKRKGRCRESDASRYLKNNPDSFIEQFPIDRFDYKTHAREVYKWVMESRPETEEEDITFYIQTIAERFRKEGKIDPTHTFWIQVANAIEYVQQHTKYAGWLRDLVESAPERDADDVVLEVMKRVEDNPHAYTDRSIAIILSGMWGGYNFKVKGKNIPARTMETWYVSPARYLMKKGDCIKGLVTGVYRRIRDQLEVDFESLDAADTIKTEIFKRMGRRERNSIKNLNTGEPVTESYARRIVELAVKAYMDELSRL